MNPKRIVVVGGALSGPTAAARAREFNEEAEIILLERGPQVSYAVCSLAYIISNEVAELELIDQQRADYFKESYNIEVRTGTEVVALDPARKQLKLSVKGSEQTLSYDALVFAPGSASLLPANAPQNCPNLVVFRTLEDAQLIQKYLNQGKKRIAVIGGGPMGIEATDGLLRAGAKVHIIEKTSRLLPQVSAEISRMICEELSRQAQLHLNTTVKNFETKGAEITALLLSDGEKLEVDLVISAIGLQPRTELLRNLGTTVAENGTLLIDERCRTSLPDIYACGVCVSIPQVLSGDAYWSPQGALADKTAQVAGANAAGGDLKIGPALDTLLLRSGNLLVGRTGLSYSQAVEAYGKQKVAVSVIESTIAEPYMQDPGSIVLKLCWHRPDGKILGLEAAGTRGVDGRIDAAAVAILSGATIEKLAGADLGFIPPLAQLRDPLNVVATIARAEQIGMGEGLPAEQLTALEAKTQILLLANTKVELPPALKSARRISLSQLRSGDFSLESGAPLLLVCEKGRTSWLGTRILRQRGYANARYLSGGLQAAKRLAHV